jgi:hypothetical protein
MPRATRRCGRESGMSLAVARIAGQVVPGVKVA